MLHYKTISLRYSGRDVKYFLRKKGFIITTLSSLLKEIGYEKPQNLVEPVVTADRPEEVKKRYWILSQEFAYRSEREKESLKSCMLLCIRNLLENANNRKESAPLQIFEPSLTKSYLGSYVDHWFIENVLERLIIKTLELTDLL